MLWDELTNAERSAILDALDPVCRRMPRVAAFVVATVERRGHVGPRLEAETVDQFLSRAWPARRRGVA
jgi:hypothetical protein